MKLDAGDALTHFTLNQPFSGFQWKQMIGGLTHLQSIVLQSMFVQGVIDNTTDPAVKDWLDVVEYLRPEAVQVYTVDRPTRHEGILAVSRQTLQEIARRVTQKTSIPAYIYE